MIGIDFDKQATVLVLPTKPREAGIRTVVQECRLDHAIRFAMEELPAGKRSRALIRTADRSLFSAEIEAIYAHPVFRQQSHLSRCA
ncbi:hypothetical protein [Aliihoeflea sp. 40Bstr573]|uniref:hypothetical protein n=1 Tax=Aliihoeflea sp. 40Bstr573 TaxID=2696467 RepID=UPI002095D0EC|nr:hypothetical protein [Aliihoeflea sp. 40Bstr573]MCO6387085.1 hypothetical protein [Aliihoeflea sp. 40Bstr573]